MDVVAYVDGFHLYHGLKSKYGRAYLWLDLVELVREIRRDDVVLKVRYFTAIVKGEPDAALRQETYLAALAALSRGGNRPRSLQEEDRAVQGLRLSMDLRM
ncbi:PIN domain-containing protein [Sphaerisporangium rhizosphaerae]|uniref:NYN domain-containing protein n=1 Tax=Sphaerisporangium rhizosphaerae TaxID=2269375 RepID=A0ABW2PGX2_9ACTN